MTNPLTKTLLTVNGFAMFAVLAAPLVAQPVVVDNFADGIDDNAANPLDTAWWTSSSSAGIEENPGPPASLGLVSGSSGRGVHTIFTPQTLNVGDSLVASFNFTTPATVGTGSNGLRIGLFDHLGQAGLDDNVSASSSSPNALYGWGTTVQASGGGPFGPGTTPLPGYMATLDINNGSEAIGFREHAAGDAGTGRLMATTSNFDQLSTGGDPYTFAASTDYTGVYTLTRTNATDLLLAFTLSNAGGTLSTHSETDTTGSFTFSFLGFHANSNVFGSSNAANTPDNGIDFTNVAVTFVTVPEPATLTLGLLGGAMLIARRRK